MSKRVYKLGEKVKFNSVEKGQMFTGTVVGLPRFNKNAYYVEVRKNGRKLWKEFVFGKYIEPIFSEISEVAITK